MDEKRPIEELERESERLGEHIDRARDDWEAKKADSAVPGAVEDVAGMEGEDGPETDYPTKR